MPLTENTLPQRPFFMLGPNPGRLSQVDYKRLYDMARARWERVRVHNFKHREGDPMRTPAETLQSNVNGMCSEKVFANYMGWFNWWPAVQEPRGGWRRSLDVHGFEVRSTPRPNGRLMIHPAHPKDPYVDLPEKENSPFVLMIKLEERVYRVAGWCWGYEGVTLCPDPKSLHPKFFPTHNINQCQLRSFEE
jgi:hypothetical protein